MNASEGLERNSNIQSWEKIRVLGYNKNEFSEGAISKIKDALDDGIFCTAFYLDTDIRGVIVDDGTVLLVVESTEPFYYSWGGEGIYIIHFIDGGYLTMRLQDHATNSLSGASGVNVARILKS